ncbi:MAG TPA: aminomethyltransferase family protein [Pyrinomonadaceae bacterium]|nr:aminomethyltransferase family protein [Pyrinomonadaceae bacterium]
MSEVTEQIAARSSPLDETHKGLGAEMREEGEWRLPSSYGDPATEYRAVRDVGGAGLIDLSSRGRIEVAGSEAVQFLNGLITNDVKALEEGAWMPAAFPNVQGRLIAEARVLRLAPDRFLFDTEAMSRAPVLKTLERFTLAGDFRVADLTDEVALLSVQGTRAASVIAATLSDDTARVERGRISSAKWNDQPLYVIRASVTAEDGFELFVKATGAASLWDALTKAGARPVGFDALEVLRIEAGVARYGVDVDETNVVLEAVADDAVSFTKGCYIGQEIIARIHWRGHVAKKLTGLVFDQPADAKRDDKIRATDGREIGRLTSVTFSPRLRSTVALGYVKYDYLAPGTKVKVISGEIEFTGVVSALPHVRGSWYDTAAVEDSAEAHT